VPPASAARKRALAFGYEGEHFTYTEWLALLEFYGHRCLRCGSREQLTVDHVIPLSLGGSNSIDNIQPLCEGCNLRKDQDTTDYRPSSIREGVQLA
jgi:5-methylcytosine-specific restriction endonuclease McrA